MTTLKHAQDLPVFDSEVAFDQDRSTNNLIINNHQHIPDSFLSDLKKNKMDSARQRSGEFMLAFSIPVEVIDEMQRRYNFDAMEAPFKEVRRMLERLQMDDFIATNKRI